MNKSQIYSALSGMSKNDYYIETIKRGEQYVVTFYKYNSNSIKNLFILFKVKPDVSIMGMSYNVTKK